SHRVRRPTLRRATRADGVDTIASVRVGRLRGAGAKQCHCGQTAKQLQCGGIFHCGGSGIHRVSMMVSRCKVGVPRQTTAHPGATHLDKNVSLGEQPIRSRCPISKREPSGKPSREQPVDRVLVIDDNPDAADSLAELLELGNHTIEIAYSSAEGLEKARNFKPEVVICDIGLPEMDGYQVARAMRSDPALASARLIALTGYA